MNLIYLNLIEIAGEYSVKCTNERDPLRNNQN